MARRLVTTLLSASLAVALATAAAAASDPGGAPVQVPESGSADRAIAAADAIEARVEAILDDFGRRLDRLARSSARPRTAAHRVAAVQLPDDPGPDSPTDPTDTGGEGEPPTTATTTTQPSGPTTPASTSTTTTTSTTAPESPDPPELPELPEPPEDCEAPDEAAIEEVMAELNAAMDEALREFQSASAGLRQQADADEAALEAALAAARTVADVEQAFDRAEQRANAYYDGYEAAIGALKQATMKAYHDAAAGLIAACAYQESVEQLQTDLAELVAGWDQVLGTVPQARAASLAKLAEEKATFLADFAPVGGGNGGGNGGGGAGGGQGGDGDGPSGDGASGGGSRLPFAGSSALSLLVAGLALVGAGALTVVMSRRRPSGEPSS